MTTSRKHPHAVTAAADRLPLATKVGYGFGGMSYNIMANGVGNLAPFIFNILLGVNPALVGLAIALPRLYDAVTDPVMGAISDNFRSRWGRRKPFMLAGGLGAGAAFAAIWWVPTGWAPENYFWWLLGLSLVFYTFVTLFSVPWTGLGFSLTPDYNERTRLMAVNNFMMSVSVLLLPWLFALTKLPVFRGDGLLGARAVGVGSGLLIAGLAVLAVVTTRETVVHAPPRTAGAPGLWKQFTTAVGNAAFLKLSAAVLLMCMGIFSVSAISPYIAIYYIYGGAQEPASVLMGAAGTAWAVAAMILVGPVSMVATRIGKRHALVLFLLLSLAGSVAKWFCYTPDAPWLYVIPNIFYGLGFCALFTLVSSMMADVCDYHELRTGSRNEATLGAVYSWVMKMGVTAAFAVSGFLLNLTGFDAASTTGQSARTILQMRLIDLALPGVAIMGAILLVWSYPITERRALAIRRRLERRRGVIEPMQLEPGQRAKRRLNER
jgi:GPH family glycoside/pentoside/hexuronide:cation symporter